MKNLYDYFLTRVLQEYDSDEESNLYRVETILNDIFFNGDSWQNHIKITPYEFAFNAVIGSPKILISISMDWENTNIEMKSINYFIKEGPSNSNPVIYPDVIYNFFSSQKVISILVAKYKEIASGQN